MCGIFGYASAEAGRFDSMLLGIGCAAMCHRGPDAEGAWHDDYCGLGHRRLSIIDLQSGAQPMLYANRYAISYNGEIYNYRELKRELASLGYVFATQSDTEVILAAYARWGADAPTRLRGIFAFAIWDRLERSLFLARDHFGVKPLVYSTVEGGILFSSELKGLLAAGIQRQIDAEAASDYLALGYVLGSKTMVRSVRRVEPATTVIWRGGQLNIRQYWDLAAAATAIEERQPEGDRVSGYVERLQDAVSTQMVADVPVGAFLSGGLDSSSVSYFMKGATGHPLKTFTMGFREPSFSELPFAERVASALGTEHYSEIVTEDLGDSLPELVRAFDEPLGDTSIVPTYYVSRLASRHVKVVLSGDGADETLAGYDTYVADKLQRVYRKMPALVQRSVSAPLTHLIPDSRRKVSLNYRLKQFVRHAHEDWRRAHYGWRLLFGDRERHLLLGDAAEGHDPFTEYRAYFDVVKVGDELNQALYVDLKTWLANDILPKVDRASMSVGLEARVPFLDPPLAEYTLKLPRELKMNGFKRKVVLREAMATRLPEVALNRRKRGFNAPVSDWMRGTLRPIVADLLRSGSVVVDVRQNALQTMWRDHQAGHADHGFALWSLVSLLLWERAVFSSTAYPAPGRVTA